jgi:hypothetical protein
MKAVMKIVVAAASITGATVPAAAQPAAPGFYFGAPSVAVTVGPRHYYRAARYVWVIITTAIFRLIRGHQVAQDPCPLSARSGHHA